MNNILDIISDLDSHPEDEKVLNALYPQDKDTIYTRFCDKCEQILRKNPNNRILKKLRIIYSEPKMPKKFYGS